MIRPSILAMKGYTPGEQLNDPGIVKLNTNENPYPPSPLVFEAVRAALTGDRLRKYPQPMGDTFRAAAAEALGVSADSILIGNGSDDILTILTRAFVPEGGRMASLTPSYSLYQSLADIQGATFHTVSFQPDWTVPKPWPLKGTHLTYLANPNSPSGTVLRPAEVEALARQVPGMFVLDEAYADFAEDNGVSLLAKLPNLVITRTFSKFYALAGIRFGFAIAAPAIIRELAKVKDSYNCDVLSLAAATAAIGDQEYYAGLRSKILASRGRLSVSLAELGFQVTPSQANFLWCRRPDRPLKPIYESLKQRKILVRHMTYEGYGDGLRITVGSPAEIEKLLSALRDIL